MSRLVAYCTENKWRCALSLVFLSTATSLVLLNDNPVSLWLDQLILSLIR